MVIRRLALILILILILILTTAWTVPVAATQRAAASVAAIGCTQSALAAALAAGGSISFNCGPGAHSILFSTPLVVTTTASIDGGDQITASGQNSTTLFLIQPGAALTLTHLTVTKGFANADGGAMRVSSGGALVIDHCTFSDNHAGDAWSGGAIYNAGNLLVDTDQLHDNHADGAGGAIDNVSPGSLLVRNAVLRHNVAGGGGAIENGSNATVLTSTLAGNSAELYGGAIDASDHTDVSKALTVTASTLSGNSAASAGGAIESEMQLALTNVTLSGNAGPEAIDHYDRPITLTNVTLFGA